MYERRRVLAIGGVLATGGCLALVWPPRAGVGIENDDSSTHRVRVVFRNAETDEIAFETRETVGASKRIHHEDVLDLPEADMVLTTSVDGSVVDERTISTGFVDVHVIVVSETEIDVEFTVA